MLLSSATTIVHGGNSIFTHIAHSLKLMNTDTSIFYIPTAYLHRIRLCRNTGKIISWWGLLMVPTLGYSLLLQQTIHWTTIWSYALLAIAVVTYYELGYIFNDTYTTKRELQPTIRLSERQSAYFYRHMSSIVAIRLVWVFGLLCTYGILNSWSGNSILTIFGVLLLIPIFSLYNHLRNLPAVLFYPVLVGWRYVVFLLPVWGNDYWWIVATLLLLSYPIEIGIERYSMPQHRYGWMATIIPDEQSKQKFRAYYYLTILCVLLPVWLHHPAWCIPILCIGIYRWMRYAPKYVCWALLLLPNLYILSVYGDLQTDALKAAVFLFVSIVCLLIPATIFQSRTYFIIEGIISLPILPIELASIYIKRIPTNDTLLGLITGTTLSEASELLSSMIPFIACMVLIWAMYIVALVRMPNERLFTKTGIIILWICLIPVVSGILGTQVKTLSKYFIPKFGHPVRMDLTFPYDFYISAQQLWQSKQLIDQQNKQLSTFSFGLESRHDSIPEHYILVLGESARADHMQMNGYKRPTNPYLSHVENIFSFDHVYSEANLTTYSIPLMLTRANACHYSSAFQEKSISEAFAEAGFQTAWISNNCKISYVKRIMQTADFTYESVSGMEANSLYDSVLVDQLSNWYSICGSKTFSVIHLSGSHYKYSLRYPHNFEYFTPAIQKTDGHSILNMAFADQLTNSYDNSLLYSDYILSQIIDLLKSQPGITGLIYVSDHGEQLFTEAEATYSHGSADGQEAEYNIPCFIWVGDQLVNQNKDKLSAIKTNQHKFISTQSLFYTLADMANIKPLTDKHFSLLSPEYTEPDTIFSLTGSEKMHFTTR